MLTFPLFLIGVLLLTFLFFWQSDVHWGIKSGVAGLYFFLVIIFWTTASTYLGYPTDGDRLDGKVITIYSVVVREPTKRDKGGFYITARDRLRTYDNVVLRLFGAKLQPSSPRLFMLPYDKKTHKGMMQLQKKLQNCQPVTGKFNKNGNGKQGQSQGEMGEGVDGKGGGFNPGGDSYHFDELPPAILLPKPSNPLDNFESGRTFQT